MPSYSDYLAFHRIQAKLNVDPNVAIQKFRKPSAYGGYDPVYQIARLPPNVFIPGRLVPREPVVPPYEPQWVERTASGSRFWRGIASSADGTKLAAVGGATNIWTYS